MTIYRYDPGSLIDEVRVVTNANGGHRAYLHARTDATADQLNEIQRRLSTLGYKCVPISEQGKPLLEVRGFKKTDEFCGYLKNHGWCAGKEDVITLKSDVVSKKEKFANQTLKATGIVYNVGDAAYLTYAVRGFKHEKDNLSKVKGLLDGDVLKLNEDRLAKLAKATTETEQKALSRVITKDGLLASAKLAHKGGVLDVGGGIGYALGSYALTAFGNKDQSQYEIKNNAKKVQSFMRKEGMAVPEDSAAHEVTKKEHRSTWQKFKDFGRKHPSEILNTVYVGVGLLLAAASIERVRANWIKGEKFNSPLHVDVRNDVKDIGLGAITMTSALTGLLVKEKKREPDEPKKTGIARVGQWIQEKPLRATGVGYFISTLFHGWATLGKYKAGDEFVRKTVFYRGVFVAANIVAEALLFASSKGHGQGVKSDHSTDDTVIAMSAELIAKQNPTYQSQLIDQVAGHLSAADSLGGKAETIASKLREQVAMIQKNPWCASKSTAPKVEQQEAPVVKMEPTTQVDANSIDLAVRQPLKPVEQTSAIRA